MTCWGGGRISIVFSFFLWVHVILKKVKINTWNGNLKLRFCCPFVFISFVYHFPMKKEFINYRFNLIVFAIIKKTRKINSPLKLYVFLHHLLTLGWRITQWLGLNVINYVDYIINNIDFWAEFFSLQFTHSLIHFILSLFVIFFAVSYYIQSLLMEDMNY